MPKRENKSRYAVLGLLTRGPQSGYDIKKSFETGLSSFWSESYGQIYVVLKCLVDQGLATKSIKRQQGRPDRHIYRITARGREVLRKWLAEPVTIQVGRHEMVLKLLFGNQVTVEQCLDLVRSFRKTQQAELIELQGERERLKQEKSEDAVLPYFLMTMRYGELVNEAYLKWCDETLRELEKMETGKRGDKRKGL
jgi:DNA-binding PadR family transcriptional regulator